MLSRPRAIFCLVLRSSAAMGGGFFGRWRSHRYDRGGGDALRRFGWLWGDGRGLSHRRRRDRRLALAQRPHRPCDPVPDLNIVRGKPPSFAAFVRDHDDGLLAGLVAGFAAGVADGLAEIGFGNGLPFLGAAVRGLAEEASSFGCAAAPVCGLAAGSGAGFAVVSGFAPDLDSGLGFSFGRWLGARLQPVRLGGLGRLWLRLWLRFNSGSRIGFGRRLWCRHRVVARCGLRLGSRVGLGRRCGRAGTAAAAGAQPLPAFRPAWPAA